MPVNLQLTKAEVAEMRRVKGSKLLPYKGEIVYLRSREGASFAYIQKWLAKQNIDSSSENIRQYYERYKSEFSDAEFQLIDQHTPFDEDAEYKYYDEERIEHPFDDSSRYD